MLLKDLLQILSSPSYDPETTNVLLEDNRDDTSDIDIVHSTNNVIYLGTDKNFEK